MSYYDALVLTVKYAKEYIRCPKHTKLEVVVVASALDM